MIQSNRLSNSLDLENLFLTTGDTKYEYSDLLSFSVEFSNRLKSYGYTGAGPIGIYAKPSGLLVFMIAACWLQNIPYVIFDPTLPDQLIQEYRNSIRPELLITDKKGVTESSKTIPLNIFDLNFDKHKGHDSISAAPDLLNKPEDIFGYFFTSGTSGSPKIVPLKRRQMITAAVSSAGNLLPQSNEYWMLCLPLHHIGGISVILRSLLYGSAIKFTHGFNAAETRHILSNDKKTVAASLVPTMLRRLLDKPKFGTHENFKGILLGGGPISPNLVGKCIERNVPVITSYGMTETCAQIAANPFVKSAEDNEKLDSVGAIFIPNEIKICDKNGQVEKTGKSGTIWLRGPQVFDGYYDQKNAPKSSNGWFNTGDFGRLDANSNLFIEARRTDLIVTGGENVSPYEVEEALLKLTAIKEAAVFGVPDDEWGQKVVAAIVGHHSSQLPTEELKEKLSPELQDFKIPKEFISVKSLPKTRTGKIERASLHDLYQSK